MNRPDVIVTRVDGSEGLPSLRRLSHVRRRYVHHGGKRDWYGAEVVAVTTSSLDPAWIVDLLSAGATGYLSAIASAEELAEAIERARGIEVDLSPGAAALVLEMDALGTIRLTAIEKEILDLRAAGKSVVEIADELVLSERRPRRHLHNVTLKLWTRPTG